MLAGEISSSPGGEHHRLRKNVAESERLYFHDRKLKRLGGSALQYFIPPLPASILLHLSYATAPLSTVSVFLGRCRPFLVSAPLSIIMGGQSREGESSGVHSNFPIRTKPI